LWHDASVVSHTAIEAALAAAGSGRFIPPGETGYRVSTDCDATAPPHSGNSSVARCHLATHLTSAMKNCFFSFWVSDQFGWGVYGFNLVTEAFLQRLFVPIPLAGINFSIPLDPVSHWIFKTLEPTWKSKPAATPNDAVLVHLGNSGVQKLKLEQGIRQIGITFFEHNPLADNEIEALHGFDLIVAGSTWNLQKLTEFGIHRSRLIVQGINAELFRPMPKKAFKDRFVVFSGGKLEFRKGQDLVVSAFSKFARKHDDALLLAAWSSPWRSQIAPSVNLSSATRPLRNAEDFPASVASWTRDNGIDARQFIDLGAVPNRFMPDVLREVDIALFPNRCEGGTNLVAMEALACGVPCSISMNTGHLDIIGPANCLPLTRQRHVGLIPGIPTRDWGESDVDEIICHLETAYTSPDVVDRTRARNSVLDLTWARSIAALRGCIED
jgi:glycosyltransferase involved in cell wall biosynthesis